MTKCAPSPSGFVVFYSEALWRISAYETTGFQLRRYVEPRAGYYHTEFVGGKQIDFVPYYAGAVVRRQNRVDVEENRDGCLRAVRSWLRDARLACNLAWPDLRWLTLPQLRPAGGPETEEEIESLHRTRLEALWVRLFEESCVLRRRYRELRACGEEGPQPEPTSLPDWSNLAIQLAAHLVMLEGRDAIDPRDRRAGEHSPWFDATLGGLGHWSDLLRLERGSSPGPLRDALATAREAVEALYAAGRDFDEFVFLDGWELAHTLYESWRADSVRYLERVRALTNAVERLDRAFRAHSGR